MVAYADLNDILGWLNLDNEDEQEHLEDCLETASRAIDSFCGWSFTDDGSASRVFIPHTRDLCYTHPMQDTDTDNITVEVDNGFNATYSQTWTHGTHYQIEPLNRIRGGQTFPWHKLRAIRSYEFPRWRDQATVRVTADWGWATVPEPVKVACLLEASRLHMRRRGVEGVVGFEGAGVARLGLEMDKDAAAKLRPYVSPTRFGGGLRG